MTPVYVAFRLAEDDEYLLPNFVKYYKSLNVAGFFSNLNYRLDCDRESFESFVERIKTNYPEIIFNTGPNNLEKSESENITQIYNLMKNNIPENSYIIPADADEFHQYPFKTLEQNISYLQENNFLYIKGSTCERVSNTGDLMEINPTKDIFGQCPKSNKFLFSKPKISLMSNLHMYARAGVGHHDFFHGVDAEIKKLIADKKSITHHFRWTKQGKIRTQKWHTVYTNSQWKGWGCSEETRKRLKMYDMNLLESNWSQETFNSL